MSTAFSILFVSIHRQSDSVSAEKHRRAQCYETSYILVFASGAGTQYEAQFAEIFKTAKHCRVSPSAVISAELSDSVNSDRSGRTQQICQEILRLVERCEMDNLQAILSLYHNNLAFLWVFNVTAACRQLSCLDCSLTTAARYARLNQVTGKPSRTSPVWNVNWKVLNHIFSSFFEDKMRNTQPVCIYVYWKCNPQIRFIKRMKICSHDKDRTLWRYTHIYIYI